MITTKVKRFAETVAWLCQLYVWMKIFYGFFPPIVATSRLDWFAAQLGSNLWMWITLYDAANHVIRGRSAMSIVHVFVWLSGLWFMIEMARVFRLPRVLRLPLDVPVGLFGMEIFELTPPWKNGTMPEAAQPDASNSAGRRASMTQAPTGTTERLHKAVEARARPAAIRELLEEGACVDQIVGHVWPLFSAAGNGQSEVAQMLLDSGADVNKVRADNGCTSLYHAIEKGHSDVVCALLASGASVNSARYDGGATALAVACQQGHREIVRILLDHGAVETSCCMPSGQIIRKMDDVTSDAQMLQLLARKRCAMCERLCNVKRCERCRLVSYCSRECQRRDWAQHKPACTEAQLPFF